MPRCPYCDSELPGLQTLCDACYEKGGVDVGKPHSFAQTVWQFLENPLDITDQDVLPPAPISLTLSFWCFGLLLCWFGGWAKARYEYAFPSDTVLRGALLCAGIALTLALALGRRGLRVYWDAVSVMFLLASIGVSGHFFVGSNAIKALTKAVKW